MKNGTLAASALALLLALPSFALDTIEKTLPTMSGEHLKIDLESGGDLHITGWDQNEVQVVVRPGGRDQDNVRVDIEKVSGGVEIRSETIRRQRRNSTSFKYEIKVPRAYNMTIESTGGSVRVEDVEGTIEGETMGGELELRNLRGNLDLSTMGGQILLVDSEVDGAVSTMGGDVEIRDVVGDVDASTMGGDVKYHNVQRRQGAEAKVVKISTMGGRIDVPDAPGGADLKTMGGEINVDRAQGFVKANTMGGQIDIREIDGWVDAETMGGDVNVTMVGDASQGKRDVRIESMGGTIVLTVPNGLDMSFDIEIEITKRADREYEILSDFPMEQSTKKGARSRFVTGAGTVGSGEHEIHIRTTNGDVEIRRGN